jgi:hypothetical protein
MTSIPSQSISIACWQRSSTRLRDTPIRHVAIDQPVPKAEPFNHPDWLTEAKFDGERLVKGQLRQYLEHASLLGA